ncbi:MAG: DNA translocase FtsK 4TM domain-containing protein [Candidatus Cryptobacteroides sp.]
MKKLINLQEEQKELLYFVIGCAVVLFDVFTFVSIFSYLLHWRVDMSGEVLQNMAGSWGYRYARFLVSKCFGLASFAFNVFLTALAVKLLKEKTGISLFRFALLSAYGSFVFSLLFAFIGGYVGLEFAFGGGLGGDVGRYVVALGIGAMGPVVTLLLIVLLILIFFIFACKPFARMLASSRKRKEKQKKERKLAETVVEEKEEQIPEEAVEEMVEAVEESVEAVEPVKESADEQSEYPEIQIVEGEELETDIKKPLPRIDTRLDMAFGGLPNFKFFSLELLKSYDELRHVITEEELNRNKVKICNALRSYKIEVAGIEALKGPTVTLYKVIPGEGVKISQIKNLQEDVAMSLNAEGVRMFNLSDAVGIEVANDQPSVVPLRALLNSDSYKELSKKYELPVALGVSVTQKNKIFDLTQAPHLLVAGATQQGKSVCLNVIITSLLYGKHPSELKFVFIDPKMVEFSLYSSLIKHYLAVIPDAEDEESEKQRAIVKTAKDAQRVLMSLCEEMDQRYQLLAKAGINKITLYNEKFKDRKLNPENGHRFLPYLVVVVDEYADLTMVTGGTPEERAASRKITNCIIRLAQKGRAAGLHVILATQRPSVDVVSGSIKTNFPMRIAFRTSSRQDSMTIIDAPGAEKLIGRGDMIFFAGIERERVQCALVESEEVSAITDFISSETKYGQSYNIPYYLPEPPSDKPSGTSDMSAGELDDRFEEAARLVVSTQNASTSSLQTRMSMGFAKSARVMSQLEAAGIVGPQDGAKKRQVLVGSLEELDELLSKM